MSKRRRYEILQDPITVREDVLRAIGEDVLIHLDIRLADIYEDGLDIPNDIEQREIDVDVRGVTKMTKNRLRANGFTTERQTVSLIIPPAETPERCTLSLLDKSI